MNPPLRCFIDVFVGVFHCLSMELNAIDAINTAPGIISSCIAPITAVRGVSPQKK